MITIIVMIAAKNTKPPKTPKAIIPPMFRRAEAALLFARKRLSPISLSCVLTIGTFGLKVRLFEIGRRVVVVLVLIVVVVVVVVTGE